MITFEGVSNAAAASSVFVEQVPVRRSTGSPTLQRRVLVIGQYDSAKSPDADKPKLITSKAQAVELYGRGSALAAMVAVQLKHAGGVPVYALPVADATAGVKAVGSVTITGAASKIGTLSLYIAGVRVPVAVASGENAAAVAAKIRDAVTANLDLPVVATVNTANSDRVVLTARHAGTIGNDIAVSINSNSGESLPDGLAAVTVNLGSTTAGANDPSLTNALENLGGVWYTDIVMPYRSTEALAAIEASGRTRAAAGVKRPFLAFVGYTGAYDNYLTAVKARNSQWVSWIPVHGSDTPAYLIAASAATVFSASQQAAPGRPVRGAILPGVRAAEGNDQTYAQRDTAIKSGGSYTANGIGGLVMLGDVATTKTTDSGGAATDEWRFAVTIPNLQFKINALEQTFLRPPFARAVVLADDGPPAPEYGVRPSTAKAYAVSLVDDWVARGLSTGRDEVVKNIVAEIDKGNAGRINLSIPDTFSAGLRITAIKLEWAFLA